MFYPTRDPMRCTVAVFEALLSLAKQSKRWVDNEWKSEDQFQANFDMMDREEAVRQMLPTYFPPLLVDEDG